MRPRPYYLYVLVCRDGSWYTGITTDPDRRLEEHNNDQRRAAKYTWSRRPVRLLGTRKFPDRSSASRVERWFKRLPARDKRELLGRLLSGELPRSAGGTLVG